MTEIHMYIITIKLLRSVDSLPNVMISSTLVLPHDTQLLRSALTPLPLRHCPHK